MIGTDQNDSASVLSQDQSLKSPSGKMGSDLVSEDTMISKDGSVIGTLKYVSQWKEFSNSKEEQSGYYFPVILDEKYKGKEITCTGTKVTKAVDLEWALMLKNNKKSKFTFSTDEDGEILQLSFDEATFDPPVGELAVAVAMGIDFSDECGKSEDFCSDVTITWDGINGKVSGNFYKQNPTRVYNIPIRIDDYYNEKEITIGSSDRTLLWHVALKNDNPKDSVVTIQCESLILARLTFKDANFNEGAAPEA